MAGSASVSELLCYVRAWVYHINCPGCDVRVGMHGRQNRRFCLMVSSMVMIARLALVVLM